MAKRYLTKSKIIAGRQCEKRLWLEEHKPDLAYRSPDEEHRLERGKEVGKKARDQYPEGVLIPGQKGEAISLKETKRLLKEQPDSPLFEATFERLGVLVRNDILVKNPKGFSLVEVKSSAEVKDYHYDDCAIQTWVLEGSDILVGDVQINHINNQFVYDGSGYDGLLKDQDVTTEVRARIEEVPKWVRRYKRVLDSAAEPKIDMGPQCTKPYACPFMNHCEKAEPKYSTMHLPAGRTKAAREAKAALRKRGIKDIRDIPDGCLDDHKQEWVRLVTIKGKPELNPDAAVETSKHDYPRYYLDFETIDFAVPKWIGTRPYKDVLPFQWSCHIERSSGKLEHKEFIDISGEEPSRACAESLLRTVRREGPIFVYSGYEKRVLTGLAERYPDLAEDLEKMKGRLVDLLPIAEKSYYHPDMLGSWSIKKIAPTIPPHIDYSSLGSVQDGVGAGNAYLRIIDPATDSAEREKLKKELLEYCEFDTKVLVELVRFFSGGAKKPLRVSNPPPPNGNLAHNFRIRRSFGHIEKIIEFPHLLEIQRHSYDEFLQRLLTADRRTDTGLQGVFRSVFPIKDFNETASLEFVNYTLGEPKYSVEECHQRGMTYAAPLKVTIQLVLWDVDSSSGARTIKNVKEQEVYFGEVPLMTNHGTFMVNGTERVIVSQLHRSPGVFFDHDKGKTHASGKLLYSARVIPYRGSWIDFEFDPKDILYVRIDRRRKFHATVLLRALGMSTEDLLNYFYRRDTIFLSRKGGQTPAKAFLPDHLLGMRATQDVRNPETGDLLVKEGRKFTRGALRQLEAAGLERIPITAEEIVGRVAARDIIDPSTQEVLVQCNEEISQEQVDLLIERGVDQFEVLFIDDAHIGSSLRNTLLQDKVTSSAEAMIEVYRRLRPGDPPTSEAATSFFHNLFFNPERYNLSRVGRLKLNHKLGITAPLDQGTLRCEDILETVRYVVELKNGNGVVDDIDHLGNRRVRAVGELVENQFRIGLVRMERAVKERMSLQDVETLMPQELVNYKPVSAALKEFFGSSQLSQFMDQTNPLSEVTHKRRLSALGPGGLTRERAGFEVRDVHPTHYGRVCPIETPEGPNIGLISSLSTYARVNEFGFIETPYRTVESGRVTEKVHYLSALEEESQTIAQANAPVDATGNFVNPLVSARLGGEFVMVQPDQVQLMDISPTQLVSVAAALIPFLEHDDANRALMGSNMQRQAVPLLRTEAPLVGTGMEQVVARDSGATLVAQRDGIVESVDSTRVVIKAESHTTPGDVGVDMYSLTKYQRSNQNTCINQRPIVQIGDRVEEGDVIADGPATEMGELALGRNVLVAFMIWGGYNFEDSILVSERLIRDDVFTSVHIEEFECVARDTKLGPEEITQDIPNVGEEALKDLDESGIVRIGAEVRPGDILVGKITPKGETQLSPEEKLLRAIFGEKAGEVRDTSLRVPPGVEGAVIDVRVFSRKGVAKDERSQYLEEAEIQRLQQDRDEEIRIIQDSTRGKIKQLLVGKTATMRVSDDDSRRVVIAKGQEITEELLDTLPAQLWSRVRVEDEAVEEEIRKTTDSLADRVGSIREECERKIERLKSGDELPPGIIKMVKVFVAIKRRLQVGDKMAGRHGNKGVLSRILPEEDMPYLEDGTPVDVVLNPLGVPSRMNVGQILETHLGWAVQSLGRQIGNDAEEDGKAAADSLRARLKDLARSTDVSRLIDGLSGAEVKELAGRSKHGSHVATPVFDGAPEAEIFSLLAQAGLPDTGQTTLYDGRTGEPFSQPVTVGVMYILKLHHLVEDKIHARSTGPYSLVTQQPLGGKAQFGGQRLGEMEVWALEAYGAAYSLQEMLTVKSDDVVGRTRMYEAIVKGENILEPGLPESFNVMIRELQSLALNVELIEENE